MRSLESVVEKFSPELQQKILEVENAGKSFLFGLKEFSISELVDMIKCPSFVEYCSETVLASTEDSTVGFPSLVHI